MILGQLKKGENQAKWRVLALKMLKSKCQSGRGSDDSWQKWFSNPSFYDIVDNTSHSTKYATIMVSSDCLAVVLGRFHEKKLLFFWILWGGEGLAQIFCHFLGPRGPLIEPSIPVPSAPIFPEVIDELKHCRQASGTPKPYIFWKPMMSAIQIRTKIQTQRQRQIKEKPETPMMWYIFEKEMTKGFWM